jgi:hypothetical protein
VAEFTFAPATKAAAKARVALEGPSGSGKTWSALSIGQGLGRRMAVIDTERGSASKYAGDFRFDTLQMHTYNPRDLVAALSAAAGAGYDVVIVDSLSHFWMGTGGMLEQVDQIARRKTSGNSWAAWKDANPMEREMIDGLLAYPGHVIVTMRTKTEWVITENDQGKKEPKKIGLKAQQRDGIEYEFDIVGDIDLDHNLVVSKSRMSALADKVVTRPNADLGAEILAWLQDGTQLPSVEDYILRAVQAQDVVQVRELYTEVQGRNLGAAPCMRDGQALTLLQLIINRGNELKPLPAAPEPASAPSVREPEPAKPRRAGRSNAPRPEDEAWATNTPESKPKESPVDLSNASPEAIAEAQKLAKLPQEPPEVLLEDDLLRRITEAQEPPEVHAVLSSVADNLMAGKLGKVASENLNMAANLKLTELNGQAARVRRQVHEQVA